jgi:NAD+ synthase
MKSSEVVRELRTLADAHSGAFSEAQGWETKYQALDQRTHLETLEILAAWTRAQVERVGAQGLLVGVSGGVDSSLAAWVMKQALPDRCLGLVLPAHSEEADEDDARLLLQLLDIPQRRVDLSPVVDATLRAMDEDPKTADPMARGNLAARHRIAVMYHLAAQMNYLVLGTSDLDETWVGYGCKGSASDIAPLVGLHKEEVRALTRLALSPLDENLAQRLSQRPASPGYFPGQLAEEELGLSYAQIGRSLDVLLESCEITAEGGVRPRHSNLIRQALKDKNVVGQDLILVSQLITRNLHKTLASPALWPDPGEDLEHG